MRVLSLLLLLTGLTSAAPSFRVTDTEVSLSGARELLARGAFEVERSPHRWYAVYFQVCGADKKPLRVDGKPLLREWGKVFTPASTGRPTAWHDVRFALSFAEIERAEGLPRGKSVLWVVCDLWDPTGTGKWVANGWNVSCPLEIHVDPVGKLRSVVPMYTEPRQPPDARAGGPKPARAARLDLQHLKLREGVKVGRCVGLKHTVYDTLWRITSTRNPAGGMRYGYEQASLNELQYGRFFETLTTAAQALELVLLAHRGATVVTDVKMLASEHFFPVGEPPHWGSRVEAVPGVGWRVGVLLFLPDREEITHFSYIVRANGQLGCQRDHCFNGCAENFIPEPHPLRLLSKAITVPMRQNETDTYLPLAQWPPEAR